MNQSEFEVDFPASKEVAVKADPIYVGDDLHIDLWVRPKLGHPKSILIRSINEAGEIRTAFLHVDEEIRVIPTFGNDVELTSAKEKVEKFSTPKVKTKKVKNSRFKFLEIFSTILAFSFLAVFLTGLLQARVVLTGSMKPSINPGDVVIAYSTKVSAPKIGDVVIYSARDLQGKAVTTWAHRIIAGDGIKGFTIKGDANAAPDVNIVPSSDIKSIMFFKIPAIGKFLNSWVILLIGSGLILMSYSIRTYRQK